MIELPGHVPVPEEGWLRWMREAVGRSQAGVAAVLGVTRQSYDDLERSERRRAITMKKLDEAAAALGCEVVYYLVPRGMKAADLPDPPPELAKPERVENRADDDSWL